MTPSEDTAVLIVGGGPTGMTAALALTLSGVPCRIVDKRPEPGQSSRALGLQARSMEVLAGLGVTDEIEKTAYRLRGASIMRGHRVIVDLTWIPPESRFPYTYVLPQAGLEEILQRRLADQGVHVERGVEVVDVPADAARVEARLGCGGSIGADWLIGADGARSRVRAALGIGFPERTTGETYYLADAILELPLELGDSAMWLGPDGPLMLMRLPGDNDRWRIFVDVTDAARGAALPRLDESVLTTLLDERGPRGASIRSLQWTSVFHTRLALADAYRAGRAFLAGDASHVFPPFGGQGMNLGIQDAVNLAWRLAAVTHGAGVELLDAYELERRPVAAAVIDDVEARRRMYALRNPLARAARDVLLALGGRSRAAARRASLQNSQLAISYRDQVPGGTHGTAPRPGDRAPHAPFAQTSTHELFGPDHATLVVFDHTSTGAIIEQQPGLTTVTVTDHTDSEGVIRQRYGVPPGHRGYVLVRPDGHIAARGTDPHHARTTIQKMVGSQPTRTTSRPRPGHIPGLPSEDERGLLR